MVLQYKTFLSIRPSAPRGAPAGSEHLKWVPTCATLIYGQHDAVLIDTQLTTQAAEELTEWVAETGKNLTAIYITYSHGDHHFGSAIVRRRFPKAKILATPGVGSRMANESSPERVPSLWEKLFPGQIPSDFASAEALSTKR